MKKAFLLFLSVVHRGGVEVEAIVDVDFSTLGNQPYHSHHLETEISQGLLDVVSDFILFVYNIKCSSSVATWWFWKPSRVALG